jgi:hypothetical protein
VSDEAMRNYANSSVLFYKDINGNLYGATCDSLDMEFDDMNDINDFLINWE